MGTVPNQAPDNYCRIRKTVLRALDMAVYRVYKPHIPQRRQIIVVLETIRRQIDAVKKFSVAFAAFVTTQARRKSVRVSE